MGDDPAGSMDGLIARMESEAFALDDPRRFFHATYLRTTRAVAEELDGGGFRDPAWVRRWDVTFAQLYLDAFSADRGGEPVPDPWRVAFDAARDGPAIEPLRHVLIGMNAHINYDLPQALLAVITPEEFDSPGVVAARQRDHRHIDTVLQSRVAAEGSELAAASKISVIDRALRPLNRMASRRFLAEAREKVWRNTFVLNQARRRSDGAYSAALAELEALCAQRVRDLTEPGFVLLRLARHGFGVTLPR